MDPTSQTPAASGAGAADAPAAAALKPVSRFVRKPVVKPEEHARINVTKLLPLLIQMAVLLLVIDEFQVEQLRFFRLTLCCFAGFAIHYFTPFRFKKPMFFAISLIGAFVLIGAPEGTEMMSGLRLIGAVIVLGFALAIGVAFYVSLRLPVPFYVRLVPVLAIAAGLAFLRQGGFIPFEPLWQIAGALFMFRMIIYAYDVKSAKKPESFMDFLNYFFLLPNFYFVLFPVIDYTTFKKSYYADDIHATAQRGLHWIARGVIHLCLYRLIYHNVVISPEQVQGFPTMLLYVFQTFWLYLQVSGMFHIAIGMLHLFGYKLPETNHLYFLASSFTDFWRRINIYWKDFMVKVMYYPTYFRFRKMNDTAALIIATLTVFVVTTVLHSYQMFWLKGGFHLRSTDLVFWGVLGVLVMFTVLWEAKGKKAPRQRSRAASLALTALSTLGVYVTISVLWSIWYSTSPVDWFDTVTYWR
jgi:alginate O-acetyltransferase complex protein AlgI